MQVRLHNPEFSTVLIGLAITKKMVESMDREIWVESEPDISSTFYHHITKKLFTGNILKLFAWVSAITREQRKSGVNCFLD